MKWSHPASNEIVPFVKELSPRSAEPVSPAPSPSTRSLIAAIVVAARLRPRRDVRRGTQETPGRDHGRVRPAVVYAGGVATVALRATVRPASIGGLDGGSSPLR
jgi:hypothetical protein